jgi:hypothetical protein
VWSSTWLWPFKYASMDLPTGVVLSGDGHKRGKESRGLEPPLTRKFHGLNSLPILLETGRKSRTLRRLSRTVKTLNYDQRASLARGHSLRENAVFELEIWRSIGGIIWRKFRRCRVPSRGKPSNVKVQYASLSA